VSTELGLGFGRIAAEYDASRPEYAPEALDRAEEVLGLGPDARVVDLAAGSGTLTRALAERFAEVVAVEPDDAMRAILARRSPAVEALAGNAERLPLPGASADAVFIGDAFHWFDGPAAVAEIERVLRRRGGVAMLWNEWWRDDADGTSDSLDPPLPAAARALLDDVYVRSGRAAARAEKADPVAAFAEAPFEPLNSETFLRSYELTGADVVDLYTTVSSVAWLPGPERDELRRELVLLLLAPSYRLEISTVLLWTRLAQ
jgi:ubiquinone/menaquinone biosynthesis C-methylase UbiE